MKTTASNLKIRQLIKMVQDGALIPRPEFQRRLVWTSENKNRFIDTVLNRFPFPEIYLANGEIDTATGEGKQLLVDGQQRVTTLVQYFLGDATLPLIRNTAYLSLSEADKREFLDYDVAVRDLGNISVDQIIEVFRRINATSYALKDIEINNAVYAGALKRFGEAVSRMAFFERHRVFRADDYKRMGDLRYALLVTVTYIVGYFNRDEEIEPALASYNDVFEHEDAIGARLVRSMDFVEECGFGSKSRAWKKGDLFTLLVEVDKALEGRVKLAVSEAVSRLEEFYAAVDESGLEASIPAVAMYYKAAVQASNDRINRVRRGRIVQALIRGASLTAVEEELRS